jgi:hypothetical protein
MLVNPRRMREEESSFRRNNFRLLKPKSITQIPAECDKYVGTGKLDQCPSELLVTISEHLSWVLAIDRGAESDSEDRDCVQVEAESLNDSRWVA